MARATVPALILFVVVAGAAYAQDTIDAEYCEVCHDEGRTADVAVAHGQR